MEAVEPIRDRHIYYAVVRDLKEWNIKYYIMFLMGSQLALRVNEILKLRVGDVKNKKELEFVQSKTGKTIAIAFNHDLLAALKEYCKDRDPNEALIPTAGNEYKPLSRKRAWEILNIIGKKYGVHMGTHTMRKTCAYHYYQKTKDIATLKIWLNHTSERDTLTYIGVTQETVKKAMINFKI